MFRKYALLVGATLLIPVVSFIISLISAVVIFLPTYLLLFRTTPPDASFDSWLNTLMTLSSMVLGGIVVYLGLHLYDTKKFPWEDE